VKKVEEKGNKIKKYIHSGINTKKVHWHLEDRGKLREIETITSTDL